MIVLVLKNLHKILLQDILDQGVLAISEGSKYPATARLEKRPGDACPFERINLSRSSQRGFFGSNRRYLLKRQPIISAIEKEPPGWPEAAAIVPFITSLRALRTFFLIL